MAFDNEEVLFTWPERDGHMYPVTLLTHSSGYSLHSQTGKHHNEAIEIASKILAWRGLVVKERILLGPSGMYYKVEQQ